MQLYQASNQWASRPADERFWGLKDLQETLDVERTYQREWTGALNRLRAVSHGGAIQLENASGVDATLTHHAFNQLCLRIGAPTNYLRRLPVDLATTLVQHGLDHVERNEEGEYEESKLLIRKNGSTVVRAITGPDYGRSWDAGVVGHLRGIENYGWRVPPARPAVDDPRARPALLSDLLPNSNFGLSVKLGDMIAPAGVYYGDRNMFIFMVNPDRLVDDGSAGLMRGFFLQNSEVGAAAYKITMFYLENVCGNHIVWGASGVTDLKIVHRKNAPVRYIEQLYPQLKKYADASTDAETNMIKAARQHVLGKNRLEVVEAVYGNKSIGLGKKEVEAGYQWAERWEHTALAPPTTAWGLTHGLTRWSQSATNADERDRVDQAAGKILQLACND